MPALSPEHYVTRPRELTPRPWEVSVPPLGAAPLLPVQPDPLGYSARSRAPAEASLLPVPTVPLRSPFRLLA